MPTPIGHSLTGYLIYRATGEEQGHRRWSMLALYLLGANSPDLDFIPGMLVGESGRYHHGPSHSLGFAILFGLVVSLAILFLRLGDVIRKSIIFFSLYFSHVILDYFSTDTSLPYGVPLLWPLSAEYYIAPFAFLPDIQRAPLLGMQFIASFFSLHNLWAVTVESLMFIPLIFLMLVWKRRPPRSVRTSAAQTLGKGTS
jgi:inner membrane protein